MLKLLHEKFPSYQTTNHNIDLHCLCPHYKSGLWFPSSYTYAESHLYQIEGISKLEDQFTLFVVPKCDVLACKKSLALLCDQVDPVRRYCPTSYTLGHLEKATSYETKSTPLILKKNIQSQRGLIIVQGFEEALKTMKADTSYVIAQTILVDAMRIQNRRINVRVYLVIKCDSSTTCKAFTYTDGFVYYSKGENKEKIDIFNIVTTGYGNREVYDNRPLTLQDLYVYLAPQQRKELQISINTILQRIVSRWWHEFARKEISRLNSRASYIQWFGVDFHVQEGTGHAFIIEINKSPSVSPHDQGRDKEVKTGLITGLFDLAKNKINEQQWQELELGRV